METANLAISDPIHHRYYLGTLAQQIVSNPSTTNEFLISCATEEMAHLFAVSRETVTLDILIGYQHLVVHEIQSEHFLKVTEGGPGTRPFFSAGALPKVLLSQLDDEELQTVIEAIRKRSLIDIPETDRELLIAESKRIRQDGYAVTYGERIAGVIGISAPVKNYMFPAALGILGPDNRLILNVPNLIKEIKECAGRVSDKLKDRFKEKEAL
jgi:DNA-binding IclR family transcriptional regulator